MAGLEQRIGRLERRSRAPLPAGHSGRPLTGEELAERLGITAETIRRWAGLGMPSCGTHPSRPSWPLYDERACRWWAGQNQPQTPLRPATGDADEPAAPAEPKESMADLRARRLHLQCQIMRERLIEERSQLIEAGKARAVFKRHADVVRATFRALPAQMAADLVETFGLAEETRARSEAILAAEMERVLAEVQDDPLADAGIG